MSEELRKALYSSSSLTSLDLEAFLPEVIGTTEIITDQVRKVCKGFFLFSWCAINLPSLLLYVFSRWIIIVGYLRVVHLPLLAMKGVWQSYIQCPVHALF